MTTQRAALMGNRRGQQIRALEITDFCVERLEPEVYVFPPSLSALGDDTPELCVCDARMAATAAPGGGWVQENEFHA